MAWTTPGTATAGDVLTASFWNTNVRDNTLALSRGIIAKATITASTSYVTAATDSGLSVTWTAESDRTYLVCAYCYVNKATTGYVQTKITDSSNNIKTIGEIYLGSSTGGSLNVSLYETGLSGSITRKFRYGADTGTARIEATSTYPAQLWVVDMGLA